MTKFKAYVFTTNNYTDEHIALFASIDCQYVVYGKEQAPTTGTEHLQGYIYFNNQRSHAAVKKLLIGSWCEPARAHPDKGITYCLKQGDVYERGTRPMNQEEKGQSEKKRWREINEHADAGDEEWLKETHPQVYFKHLATFRSHKKPKTEILQHADEDTPHEWWYGPTGTGKSRRLHAEYPDHYHKEQNKWWCNYTGQEIVAIEEASPKTMEHLASRMKLWCDRYPFPGEIKGGRIEGMRPAKIIVLSNYTIEECFPNPEDHLPMLRKMNVVKFGVSTPKPWHHSYRNP